MWRLFARTNESLTTTSEGAPVFLPSRPLRGRGENGIRRAEMRQPSDPRSIHLQQLDLEDQRRVRRDDVPRPALAVPEARRDDQLSLPAHFHPLQALLPTLDHLALAQGDRAERLAAVQAAIELLAALQGAGVVDRHLRPLI